MGTVMARNHTRGTACADKGRRAAVAKSAASAPLNLGVVMRPFWQLPSALAVSGLLCAGSCDLLSGKDDDLFGTYRLLTVNGLPPPQVVQGFGSAATEVVDATVEIEKNGSIGGTVQLRIADGSNVVLEDRGFQGTYTRGEGNFTKNLSIVLSTDLRESDPQPFAIIDGPLLVVFLEWAEGGVRPWLSLTFEKL
jgi:hypothetical protein